MPQKFAQIKAKSQLRLVITPTIWRALSAHLADLRIAARPVDLHRAHRRPVATGAVQ